MAELDVVFVDERPSHVIQKENRDEVEKEWGKLDKVNYQKSPFCPKCVYWDSKTYSVKDRDSYCQMILVSEEDAMNPKLLPDGNRSMVSIGKNFTWVCRECKAIKCIFVSNSQLEEGIKK